MTKAENIKNPLNLKEEDKKYLCKDCKKNINYIYFLKLNNIKISPKGYIFKHGHILLCSLVSGTLPNLSFKEKIRRLWKHYVFSEIKATIIKIINLNTNIFFPYLYSKKYIKKTCVWATDNWSPGYYHWIAEALPRILISENLLKNYTLLLPATLKNNDFVIKSLDCFNIKNIEYININEKVFAKELILPTHLSYSGYHNKKIINKLRKNIGTIIVIILIIRKKIGYI